MPALPSRRAAARALTLALAAAILWAPATAIADGDAPTGPWSVGVSVGSASSYGNGYLVLGARVGYAILPRLVLELDGQWWAGGSPPIGKLAPGVLWLTPLGVYFGPYYAHWFVGAGYPDQDALGARAGVTVASSGPATVGIGAAYEHTLGCRSRCDAWWPEVSVGLRF